MNWKKLGREIGLYIIGVVVIAGTLWTLGSLFNKEVPFGNKDALMMILGVLVAKFGTVVDYFFGSSKGSADKTDALAEKP